MSEELIKEPGKEENVSLAQTTQNQFVPTMWNDDTLLKRAYRAAGYLASTDLVPDIYRNKPANCLIALDVANRTGMSPLIIMQNLYIVKGKPAWSGSFCAAAINGCGKFTPLRYLFQGEQGTLEWGCTAEAKRISDGEVCQSSCITMRMAQDEGWIAKNGSKWKTMPKQMMMYRAASFFARTYCPEVLLGIQTAEEVQDVNGYEDTVKSVTTFTLDDGETNESN